VKLPYLGFSGVREEKPTIFNQFIFTKVKIERNKKRERKEMQWGRTRKEHENHTGNNLIYPFSLHQELHFLE